VIGSVGLVTSPSFLPLTPALLGLALEPVAEPLPAETLVDLLKQPLCVGAARRVVLDVLGMHYQRRFADQWDFVHFATDQHLGFDFTTSTKPPEPTGPAR
jgi:hypothetical protein